MTVVGRPPTSDTGAAALTGLLLAMSLVVVVVPIVMSVAGVLAAGDRARVAADAAALAVLSGSTLAGGAGAPDTPAGSTVARSNGAALVGVDLAGWPLAVTAEVAVAPTGPLSAVLGEVHATAAAILTAEP